MYTLIELAIIGNLINLLKNVDLCDLSEEQLALFETIIQPYLDAQGITLADFMALFGEDVQSKNFTIETDGLKLSVEAVYDATTGNTEVQVTAIEGYADLNAFYWANEGDYEEFSGFVKQDSSLNLNGIEVNWADALKLSSSGLGDQGTDKETYIAAGTENESFTFTLEGVNLDDLGIIGVRATSTSTADGSIKAAETEIVDEEPPPEDDTVVEEPVSDDTDVTTSDPETVEETTTYDSDYDIV